MITSAMHRCAAAVGRGVCFVRDTFDYWVISVCLFSLEPPGGSAFDMALSAGGCMMIGVYVWLGINIALCGASVYVTRIKLGESEAVTVRRFMRNPLRPLFVGSVMVAYVAGVHRMFE
jgi:hypothetical protein